MAIQAINREPDELGVRLGELVLHRSKCHELCGADRGEIGRVAKQYDPVADIVIREVDLPLSGNRRELRRSITETRHRVGRRFSGFQVGAPVSAEKYP